MNDNVEKNNNISKEMEPGSVIKNAIEETKKITLINIGIANCASTETLNSLGTLEDKFDYLTDISEKEETIQESTSEKEEDE